MMTSMVVMVEDALLLRAGKMCAFVALPHVVPSAA